MKNFTFLLFFLFTQVQLNAQKVASFEDLNLKSESWLNGSDGLGGYNSNGFTIKNQYNKQWGSWSGFAVSNRTDTKTRGYANQYSSIAGTGANGTKTYSVCYVSGVSEITFNESVIEGLSITNSTYAYWSMKEGDAFSKKFGGVTGTDPDWFKVTIEGHTAKGDTTEGIEVWLADYRAKDSENDYVVNQWQWVDLSGLGKISKLTFKLSSSDTGAWGMNTPAYFCIDQLNYRDKPPYIKKPVETVTENNILKQNFQVILDDVFADDDNPASEIVYKITANDNPTLAKATIDYIPSGNKTIPALDVMMTLKRTGIANIEVSATSNGRTVKHTIGIIASHPVYASENKASSLKVWPNPFANNLNIEIPESSNEIYMISAAGQVIKKIQSSRGRFVKIEGLENTKTGNYIILVKTGKNSYVQQVLKQ
jgi:hypothetical protein